MPVHVKSVLWKWSHGGSASHEHLPEVLVIVPLLGEPRGHTDNGERLHGSDVNFDNTNLKRKGRDAALLKE